MPEEEVGERQTPAQGCGPGDKAQAGKVAPTRILAVLLAALVCAVIAPPDAWAQPFADGASERSPPLVVPDTPPPPPAPELRIEHVRGDGPTPLVARWTAVEAMLGGAVTYFVEYQPTLWAHVTTVTAGAATSLTVSDGQDAGEVYRVRVSAGDQYNDDLRWLEWSPWSTVTVSAPRLPVPTLTLAEPASRNGYQRVTVAWESAWNGITTTHSWPRYREADSSIAWHHVRYRPAGKDNGPIQAVEEARQATSVKLRPGTVYEVQVRTHLAYPETRGEWSAPMTVTTEAAPTALPGTPTVSLVARAEGERQALDARWTYTQADTDPELDYFEVDVDTGSGVLSTVVRLVPGASDHEVSEGEHPVTSFTVRVRAANAAGVGPWSESATVAEHGSPPQTLTAAATAIDHQSAEVTWHPVWRGYSTEVRHRPAPFTGDFTEVTASKEGTVTITGLAPGVAHAVQARSYASSPAVQGPWSEAVTVTTAAAPAPGLPERPSEVRVSRRVPDGHDALVVRWTVLDLREPIDNHEVRYRHGSTGYSTVTVGGDVSSVTLTGLEPSRSYNVQVRASNSAGASAWRDGGWVLTGIAPITLTLSGGASARVREGEVVTLTVDKEYLWSYVTVDVVYGGTAQKGIDFTGPDTLTLTVFPSSDGTPGGDPQRFRITVLDTDGLDPDETIEVSLANPGGYRGYTVRYETVAGNTVTHTVAGQVPEFRAGAPSSMAEGESHRYVVDLNHSSHSLRRLYFRYGGTATRGADYFAPDSPLTVGAKATAVTIPVSFVSDWDGGEGTEALEIELLRHEIYGAETVALGGAGATVTTEIRDGPAIEATAPRRPRLDYLIPKQHAGRPALEVRWAVPASPGIPTVSSQEVFHRNDESGAAGTLTVDAATTVATIPDLEGLDDHSVQVRAVNSVGASEWSGVFRRQTGASPSRVRFSRPSYTFTEGATVEHVGIVADTFPDAAVTMDLVYGGGTADKGTDYFARDSVVGFSRKNAIVFLGITLAADALDEGDEIIVITLSNPRSEDGHQYTPHPTWATVTLTVKSPKPEFVGGPSRARWVEGEAVTYVIDTDIGNTQPATLGYETTGSATPGADFTVTPATWVVAPGTPSLRVTVSLATDSEFELDETVGLRLVGMTVGSATGALDSAGVPVTIAGQIPEIADAPLERREGDRFRYLLDLNFGNLQTLTLDYEFSGSATPGADFAADASPLVVGPGTVAAEIWVSVVSDLAVEPEETLTMRLTEMRTSGGGTIELAGRGRISATTSIQGQTPRISEQTHANEGTTYRYWVTMSPTHPDPVSVDYTLGGTATPGADYSVSPPSPLVFGARGALRFLTVTVHREPGAAPEPAETIDVSLTGLAGAGGLTGSFAGSPGTHTRTTIRGDTAAVRTFTLSVTGAERAPEGGTLTYVLELPRGAGNWDGTLTVDVSVSGSATPGADFTAPPAQVTFGPGETRQTVRVAVLGDATPEGDETVELLFSNPRGVGASVTVAGDGRVVSTIEGQSHAVWVQPGYAVAEGAAPAPTLTVVVSRLDTSAEETLALAIDTDGGSAGPDDISMPSAGLTMRAGTGSATVALDLVVEDDEVVEADETAAVVLRAAGGAEAARHGFAIGDNDTATLSITGPSAPAEEGERSTLLFTLSLDKRVDESVLLSMALGEGGTATPRADVDILDPGRAVFAPGTAAGVPRFVSVGIRDDGAEEPTEVFEVVVGSVVSGLEDRIDTGASARGTIAASDPLSLSITGPTVLAEDAGASSYTLWVAEGWGGVPLTVSVRAGPGSTAESPADHLPVGGLVTVTGTLAPAGVPGGVFDVTLVDDSEEEGDETIRLEAASAASGTGLRNGSEPVRSAPLAVTVTDNDEPGADAPAALDVDRDGDIDSADAEIVFMAHQFRAHLGDGGAGSGDADLRRGVLGDILGAAAPATDADRRDVLVRALELERDADVSVDGVGGFGWRDALVANAAALDPGLAPLLAIPAWRDSVLSLVLGPGYPPGAADRLALIERARSLAAPPSGEAGGATAEGRTVEEPAPSPAPPAAPSQAPALRVKRTDSLWEPIEANPGPVTAGETVHVGLYLEADPADSTLETTLPSFAGGFRIGGAGVSAADAAALARAFCDRDGTSGCRGVGTPGLQFLSPSELLPDGIGAMLADFDTFPPSLACDPSPGGGCDIPVLVAELETDGATPTGLFTISPAGLGTLGYSAGDYGGEVRTFGEPSSAEALTLEICPAAGCPPWGALSAETVTVAEGGDAAPVTLALPYVADAAWTVEFLDGAAQGAAAEAADYGISDEFLTIDGGESSATFTVTAVDDEADEGVERLVLRLVSVEPHPSGRAAETLTLGVVIEDNDAPPAVSVQFGSDSVHAPETGDGWASYTAVEGGDAATVTVLLSGPLDVAVEIPVTRELFGGAAAADVSTSIPLPGTVTFAASQTVATFEVGAVDDPADHGEEMRLGFGTLPASVALGAPPAGRVHLVEDGTRVIAIMAEGAAALTESPPSTATVSVRASLSIPAAEDVPVPVGTAGTADPDSDYVTGPLPTLVISAGARESAVAEFALTVAPDDVAEADEAVLLTAQVPGHGVEAATLTIADDDTVTASLSDGEALRTGDPAVEDAATFWQADAAEGETVAFTISLSAAAGVAIHFPYTVPSHAEDVVTMVGVPGIPAGSTEATILLTVLDDLLAEGLETVTVSLGNPVSALGGRAVLADATGKAVIGASDLLGVTMDGPEEVFAGQVATYGIALRGATSTQPTTVTVVATGTAAEAAGHGAGGVTATLTIGAGEAEARYRFGTVPMGSAVAHHLTVTLAGVGGEAAVHSWEGPVRITTTIAGTGLDIDGDGSFNSVDARILNAAMTVGEDRLGDGVTGGLAGVRKRFFKSLLGDRDPGNDLARREMLRRAQAVMSLPLFVTDIERDGDLDARDSRLLYLLLRFEDQVRGTDPGDPTGLAAMLFREWAGSGLDVPGRNLAIAHAARLREGDRADWGHAGTRFRMLGPDGSVLDPPPATVVRGDPVRVGLFARLAGRAGDTLSVGEFGGRAVLHSGGMPRDALGLLVSETCGFVQRLPGCDRVRTVLGDGVVALDRNSRNLIGMRLALETRQPGSSCVAAADGSCEQLVAAFEIPTGGIPHGERVTLRPATPPVLSFEVCEPPGCETEVSFGPGPYSGTEGDTAPVTLELGGELAVDVTIPILATGVLGADASDFALEAAAATIPAGVISQEFRVSLLEDSVGDRGEQVVLSFGDLPDGVRAGDIRSATVEIVDDDHPPVEAAFAAAPPVAHEGGPPVAVTVTLDAAPGRDVAVPLSVASPAPGSSDHSAVPGSVEFGPGDTEAVFNISAADDSEIEGDETLVVAIGAPLPDGVAAGEPSSVTVTLGDNDGRTLVFSAPGAPRISEADLLVRIPVTVSMALAGGTGASAPEQVFALSLSGSAAHLEDYVVVGALPEVRVGAGSPWTGTLTVSPLNDRVVEGDEHIVIGGSVPYFETAPATVTLGDDAAEEVAEVTIAGDLRVVDEGDTAEFRVLMSRPVDFAVEVPWSVDDPADAAAGSRAGTATLAAGAQTATIEVEIADDTVSESWELLTVSLGTPAPDLGGRIRVGNPGAGHVLVNSNDPVLVGFEEPASPHAVEGAVAEVLLTLSAPPESLGLGPVAAGSAADVTVHVTTSGTATPGRDYNVSNPVVTISGGAGAPSTPISVEVLDDAERDPGETIVIDIFAHGRGRVVVDPSGGVTLTVAERNRAPAFAPGRFARSVAERSGGGTAVGAPVTATDPDGDALAYSLEGSNLFGIGRRNGQITVLAGSDLDHESAPRHTVTVGVTDGKDEVGGDDGSVDARVPVEILVADVSDALLDLGISYVAPYWSRRESYDGTIQIRWRPEQWLPDHPGLSMELEYKLPAEPATEWRTTRLRYDPDGDAAQLVNLPRRPDGLAHVYEVRWHLRGEDGATRWRIMSARVNTFYRNPVAVATGQADAAEGDYVNVVVGIRDAEDVPVTVRYEIEEGTARANPPGGPSARGAAPRARGAAEGAGGPAAQEDPAGDFEDLSDGAVIIRPGRTSASIWIELTYDSLGEPAENFTVRLTSVDPVPGIHDDLQPEIRGLDETRVDIEANGAVVLSLGGPADPYLEEGGEAEFSVAVTGEPSGSPLTVGLDAGSGTAAPVADFTVPGSVVVPAGLGTAVFTVAALEDGTDDGGEVVRISLAPAPGGGFLVQPEPAEVTITERNSPPAFWLDDPLTVEVAEGAGPVGAPARAIDPDGDPIAYSLADLGSAGEFAIDPGTGEITHTGTGGLDFETAAFHTLAVLADDGKDGRGIATVAAADEDADDRTTVVVAVADTDEPPPAPANVSAAPPPGDGHRSLTLSWDGTAGGGPPVTGHEIEVTEGGVTVALAGIALGEGKAVGGLRPGTEHTLRVRALNDEGAGEWSAPAVAATGPGHTVSVSSVRASWQEGETASVQVDITGGVARVSYEVRHAGTDAADFAGAVTGTALARSGEPNHVTVPLNADGLPEGPEVFMVALTGVESPDDRAVLGAVTEIPVTIGGHGTAFSVTGPTDGRVARGGSAVLTVSSVGDPLAAPVTVTVGTAPAALGQELSAGSVTLGPARPSGTLALSAGAGMAPGIEVTVSLSTGGRGMGMGAPLTLTVVDPNPQPAFSDFASGAVELTVREDIEPGSAIGDPVAAADDNDDPTHTLAGGGGLFEIDAGGQVRLARGASLDHEASAAHVLVVEARDHKSDIGLPDSAVDDRVSMTVSVSDLPEPPLAPAGVTARSADVLGDSRLAVGWAAPDNTGRPEITGYDIEHRRAGESDGAYTAANVIHRGTDTSATIFGLDADTGYEVRVRARNDEDTAGGEVVAQWSPPAAGATRGGLDARVALRAEGSDDRFSHTDALLIFYSLRFGNFLRANERLLDLVYGRLMAGVSVATRQNRDIIARSEEFAAVAGHSEFDMDRNGTFDHVDALLIFYSLRFGDFLEANPRLLQLVYGRVTGGRLATLREMLEVIARSEALRKEI